MTLEAPRGWRLPPGLAARLAAVVSILLLSVLAVLCIRRGDFQEVTWGWPHSVAVAAGLAWWLWLWPSYVGWLPIIVVALTTLYRGRRRAVACEPE
jgi:hypothetical protein